jgi:K+-sensing histidine kinase KdpD
LLVGANNSKIVTKSNTDLLRVVANELKLPLTNIQATASMLSRNQFDESEVAEQNLRMLINSVQALDMIDGILLAGRVQTEQTSLDLTAINASSVARAVILELDGLAARYDRTIRLQVSDNLSLASADSGALRTSLAAMLASLIRSSTSEVIEVLVHNRMNWVMITLRDEGQAITNQTVKSILNNLGRSVQPAKALPATSGLGVYISSVLLEAMNGKFDAYTSENKRAITYSLQKTEQLSLL